MKTIKVPKTQHRSAKLVVTGEGDQRKFSMSISSDEPYLRYDWWNDEDYYELLSHAPGDVNEERLKAGLPILFNHNRDDHLGRAGNYVNDGHKCTLTDLAFSESDFAQGKMRDALSGVLPDTSVGYTVDDEGVCVGEKDGIPIYKFGWTPFEGSLVTVPADISVGVGRERDLPAPKGEPREIRIREKSSLTIEKELDEIETPPQIRETREKIMTAEEQKAADEKAKRDAETAERERQQKVTDGMKAVRLREKEIRAIAAKATNLPDSVLDNAIDDAVTNERAVDDFRKLVFEKYYGTAEPIDTPEGNGDLKPSGIRVIGDRRGKGMSIGTEFVQSKDFKERGGRKGQRRTIGVDFPDVTMLGIRGKVAMAQRAGFTSTDLSPINVQIQTGILGLGMQRLTVMDLIAPGAIAAAALIYPRENTFGTVDGVAIAAGSGGVPGMPRAKTVGERGRKPNWDPDLTTETAPVKKVAITTKVPDEFMSDFPAAQSYIDERLPFMVDTETEYQVLYGDGLNNNLKGILSTTGIQTRAIDATNDRTVCDSLRKGLTDIEVGSYFEPDGYAFHPYDWETASLLKDAQGRYLAGGPFYLPIGQGMFVELYTFWGKPVVKTTAVTYGRPVAGAWKLGAQYFQREGMRLEMTNANEDDFMRNLVAIRAEHRLALATYRPPCFLEFTGFPART